jgi:hypothetical protein
MNEIRRKPYIRVILLVLALSIAGGIGYGIGSDSMNHKWIKASQKTVPVVIDYVMERYGENPSLAESYKDLIKDEGLLLFLQGTWMQLDLKGYLEYMEKIG